MKAKSLLLLSGLLLFALTTGCQSYEDGIKAICDAPSTCAKCAQVSPDQRMLVLSEHIESQVSNVQASAIFDSLAAMAPADRAATLRGRAADVGLNSCPLADQFGQ